MIEVHKRPDCFTCHEGAVDFYDTFGGRIEAVNQVNINASTVENITEESSDLGVNDVIALMNEFIAEEKAKGDSDFDGVRPVAHNNLEFHDNRF